MTEGDISNELRQLIIPLPDEGDVDELLTPEDIELKLGLQGKRKADAMGHYSTCHWIAVEKKGVGHIDTAIEQLGVTFNAARMHGMDVRYLLIVTSGKWGKLGQRYERQRSDKRSPTKYILVNKSIRRGGPVRIKGTQTDIWVIATDDLDDYWKKNRTTLNQF